MNTCWIRMWELDSEAGPWPRYIYPIWSRPSWHSWIRLGFHQHNGAEINEWSSRVFCFFADCFLSADAKAHEWHHIACLGQTERWKLHTKQRTWASVSQWHTEMFIRQFSCQTCSRLFPDRRLHQNDLFRGRQELWTKLAQMLQTKSPDVTLPKRQNLCHRRSSCWTEMTSGSVTNTQYLKPLSNGSVGTNRRTETIRESCSGGVRNWLCWRFCVVLPLMFHEFLLTVQTFVSALSDFHWSTKWRWLRHV